MRFLSRRQSGLATGVVRGSRHADAADRAKPAVVRRRPAAAAALENAVRHVEWLEDRRLLAAQLTVVATPNNTGTANAGAVIEYDVTVRNVSSEDALNVTLTDAFASAADTGRVHAIQFFQNTGPVFTGFGGGANGPLTATVGRLNAALSATFTVRLQTDATTADGTIVTNTASVTADNAPAPPSDVDQTTITPRADVLVTATQDDVTDSRFAVPAQSVVAGLNTTYHITVRNGGPSAATNVRLDDIIPSNTTFFSFTQDSGPAFAEDVTPAVGGTGTVTRTIGTLDANTQATFTLVVSVRPSAPNAFVVTNTPLVTTTTNDPVIGNNQFAVTATTVIRTDVRITSSVDSLTKNLEGTYFPYTVNIINAGPSDAQTVNFTWSTPNLGAAVVPDYRVYYAKNATDVNGNPIPAFEKVNGATFTVTTPASPPPPPFGTFGGTIATLSAGTGSTYKFYVGSGHQQDTTQHSTIGTASPDYDSTNNTSDVASHIYDQPLTAESVPNIQTNAGQALNVETLLYTDENNWPGTAGNAGTTANYDTPSGRFNQLGYFNATIDWGDGTNTVGGVISVDGTGTYRVAGQHTYANSGIYAVQTTVTDDGESKVVGNSVATVGTAPRGVAQIGGLQFTENVLETKPVGVFSAGTGPTSGYAVSIDWGDGTAASAGTLTARGDNAFDIGGSHNYADQGTYTGSITVTGPDGIVNTNSLVVTVLDRAVVVSPVGITGQTGAPLLGVQVATFKDPGGSDAASSYTAQILWGDGTVATTGAVTYNSTTDTFSVAGSHTYQAAGTYTLTVRVSHGTAPDATARPTAVITDGTPNQQVVATPVNITATAGVQFTGAVARFTDPQVPVGPTTEYSAQIDWGDGTAPSGGTITYNAAQSLFTVLGTHTYAADGNYTLTVTILHGNSPAEVVSPTAVVSSVPTTQPLTITPVNIQAQTGVAFTGVVARFTDPQGANPGGYTGTIDWGDGTGPTAATIAFNSSTNQFEVSGTHTYATTGTFTLTATVVEPGQANSFVRPTATVTAGPPLTVNGTTFTGTTSVPLFGVTVATFQDQGPDGPASAYTASIDWGDNTPATTGIVRYDAATQVYTVVGNHTYATSGQYTVSVTVNRTSTPSDQFVVTTTGTITDAPPVDLTAVNVNGVTTVPLTNVTVATFTEPLEPDRPTSDYTATIVWGDGSAATAGAITYNINTKVYTVTGSHTYVAGATYNITVIVTRLGTAAQVSPIATINSTPPVAATAVNITGQTTVPLTNVTVATFTDPSGPKPVGSYAVTIDWGDGSATSAGTVAFDINSNRYTVTGSHTYGAAGTYNPTVTITRLGAVAVVSPTAVITSPDQVDATAVNFSATTTVPLTNVTVARFTDPGPDLPTGSYTVSIDWGDGTPPTAGTVAYNVSTQQYTVTGTHTYNFAGTYQVGVSITRQNSVTVVNPTAVVTTAPQLAATPVNVAATTTVPLNNVVVARFTDPSGPKAPGTYAATIDWGDGSTPTAGTVALDLSTGVYTVTGDHTYGFQGSYPITVTIVRQSSVTVVSPTATVTNAAPLAGTAVNVTATTTVPLNNVVVARFTDPTGPKPIGNYTATIDWGDGSAATPGTIALNLSTGVYTVTGDHTYGFQGTYNVTVSITRQGAATVVTPTATVTNAATLTATPVNVTATSSIPLNNVVVARFTDPSGPKAAGSYAATIDWGDGSAPTPGTVALNLSTGVYTVTGDHTYGFQGSYPITVTIVRQGATTVVTPTATVTNASQVAVTPVNVTATSSIPLNNVVVARFTDPSGPKAAGSYAATIDWGDGSAPTPGTVALNLSTGVYTVTGDHTYGFQGTYNITVSVTRQNITTVVNPTATVTNATPVAASGVDVTANSTVALNNVTVATFTDPTATRPASAYAATIDWGDGTTPSAGTITFDAGTQVYTVTGDHTYVATGTFGLTVTITRQGAVTVVNPTAVVTAPPAVTATSAVSFTAVEGTLSANTIVGRFTTFDTTDAAADYTVAIAWGDGSTSAGTVSRVSPGQFNVVGSHRYADDGRYAVTYVITPVAGGSTIASTAPSTAVVTDAPLQGVSRLVTATRNTTFNGIIAQVTDGNASDTSASEKSVVIQWGDGTAEAAGTAVYNASTGKFDIRGTHVYTAASPVGGYQVTVKVRDGLSSTTITSTARVP